MKNEDETLSEPFHKAKLRRTRDAFTTAAPVGV